MSLSIGDVKNDAHGSNNDYRHVIIKGQLLLNKHFVTDLLFKQDEIERFSGRILIICTPKCTPESHFKCEPTSSRRDRKIVLHRLHSP